MLLVLDESLVENLDHPELRDDIVSALEEVALAYCKGTHLVYATKRLLEVFKNCDLLSAPGRHIFHRLYEKHAQLGAYRTFFCYQLKIVANGVNVVAEEVEGIRFIRVSTRLIRQKHFLTSMPLFLTENIMDTRFYNLLARVYLVRARKSVQLSYSPRGGGGSTISDEYESIQNNQDNLCLCIADSDIKYPQGPVGETVRRLRRVDDVRIPLTEVLVLNVREIENLLPLSSLNLAVDGSPERNSCLRLFESIKARNSGYENFLDFKSGMLLKSIYESAEENYRRFWNSLPAEIGIDTPCVVRQQCINVDSCNCKIPGFGPNTLENVLAKIEELNPHKFSEMIDGYLADEYMRLGQVIVSWFCAPLDALRV